MRVILAKNRQEMGEIAAGFVAAALRENAASVLGLATGSSPIPIYQELIRLHRMGKLDFSATITFNLDEYVGLKPSHPQSFRYFMDKHLFDAVNIRKRNTHVPDGLARNRKAHCAEYERLIRDAGGVDYQVLGIGSNGHVGFNEPGTSVDSRTRVTRLAESTISDNARFFRRRGDVPTEAITLGIGTILEAKRIVLVADGARKADAIAQAIEGPVSVLVPASALQLHPCVTCVITEDAATQLSRRRERK